MIRQPIVAILGHVDHGKTTLLDKIRGTAVADKEAGAITQHSGASEIPIHTIKKICGAFLKKLKITVEIPGLLFLDSPGHEAFTSIRKRGSSIADLAVLVVDINEGFQPQTDESLNFLKEFRTPFVVTANKIDRIEGWVPYPGECFLTSFERQPEHVRMRAEEMIYNLIGQVSERGFDCERFDRIKDFKKSVAIVPTSGRTGEGIQELLMMLIGLSQTFLKNKLEVGKKMGEGSVLEVKEFPGLGKTLDVILYDGEVRSSDYLVTGGKEPIIAKIRSILKPKPLKEIRVEKEFQKVDKVTAAAGIKIAAPGLEEAIPGSPIKFVRTRKDAEKVRDEMRKECLQVEFDRNIEGVILRADTLGSLEALIHMLKQRNIPVKKAEVGSPTKKDLVEAEAVKNHYNRVIFAFNVKVNLPEAKDKGIPIFHSNVIYTLFEEYDKWLAEEKERERQEKLANITLPARIKVLKGFVFRQKDPAIVGVEIIEGTLRPGVELKRKDGRVVGEIKQLQKDGENVSEATGGERVAISIDGGVVGRNIKEGDELFVVITKKDLELMKELGLDTSLAEVCL